MIKVFIGTEPKTEIARKVLEYSIKKYTEHPVSFFPMLGKDWTIRPNPYLGTGFSLLRWDIPRRCNYSGYAIYLDADILVLGDIKELWEADIHYPNDECSVWCTYQPSKWFKEPTPETSVMFMNCSKAKLNQPDLKNSIKYIEADPNPKSRQRYVRIMRALKHQHAPQRIPNSWNRLNSLTGKNDKILHYTKEDQQPWYNPKHPFAKIWEQHLVEAGKNSFITREELEEAISKFKPHTGGKRGTGLHPHYKVVTDVL